MSVHCSLEMLSTYVDAELANGERLEVESHVQECGECRERLARLQRVVGQLKRIETVEAPPTLGGQVQRRLRLDGGRVPLARRLEDRLGGLLRPPLFAPLFALIIAFGAILYLFSLGVARQTVSGTQVVIGGSAPSSFDDLAEGEKSERSMERELADAESSDGAAVPRSPGEMAETGAEGPEAAAVASTEAPSEAFGDVAAKPGRLDKAKAPAAMRRPAGASDSLILAGRQFHLVEGVWREMGLGDRAPESRIDPRDGGVLPSELEGLSDRAGTYRVLLEGHVVEVVIRQR